MTPNQRNRLLNLSKLLRSKIISKGEFNCQMHELNKQIWAGK